MAIIQTEIRKTVAKFAVTEVRGQPTNQDIDHLEKELNAVASSIPMMLGEATIGTPGCYSWRQTMTLSPRERRL